MKDYAVWISVGSPELSTVPGTWSMLNKYWCWHLYPKWTVNHAIHSSWHGAFQVQHSRQSPPDGWSRHPRWKLFHCVLNGLMYHWGDRAFVCCFHAAATRHDLFADGGGIFVLGFLCKDILYCNSQCPRCFSNLHVCRGHCVHRLLKCSSQALSPEVEEGFLKSFSLFINRLDILEQF